MHLPLGFELISGELIGLVSVLGSFAIPITIVVSALYFKSKKQQMWHETARIALEKGQPLPPMPPSSDEVERTPPPGMSYPEWHALKRAEMRANEIKGGLVLIAVGVGLYLFFSEMHLGPMGQMRFVGAIPGGIGVALLLHALLESLFAKGPTPRE